MIVDACRNNPFAEKMKRTVGSRAISRGLARIEPATSNTLVAFAAKAGSTASDGNSKNSPYAAALVKYIATPGLDLRRVFGFVRDDVMKATGNRQEPMSGHAWATMPLVPARLLPHQQSAGRHTARYELACRRQQGGIELLPRELPGRLLRKSHVWARQNSRKSRRCTEKRVRARQEQARLAA